MAELIYTTRAGDTADYVAWKHYGTLAGRVTEQLLEANPGLAGYGPILPAGIRIVLPVLQPEPRRQGVSLWS